MSELIFIIGGKEVTAASLKAATPKQKRSASASSHQRTSNRDEATLSDGFVVTGYAPDYWAARIEDHALASKLYAQDPTKNKAPGTLEEFTIKWVRRNKPKRARTKPYEIEAAAELCADLCRKAGWANVVVDEILKA